ncbi:MAG TPA: SLC13 family permease [Burkholderiaceae bacterium]|jgi:Na+/H+ antiporter NhaD/arsenite permease-like protein|nr:SLC13 family permease [Burkholderiaceae bacterium]
MADPARPASPSTPWSSPLAALRRDRFFWVLLLVLAGLAAAQPQIIPTYPMLVDWATIAALAGLLVLTQAVESSGALAWLGRALVRRMSTERVAALSLVSAAAALSTVLTNDVALFVVVPLTLGLCRITPLPATRLIVFEALAVNVGSALTPIGNPQNLFLWQLSQVSFAEFTIQMAPLVAVLSVLLAVLVALFFAATPLRIEDRSPSERLDRPLLLAALAMYVPFLVLTDRGEALWGCALAAGVIAAVRPRVLARIDWGLLLVFTLMFIDLRLVAGLDAAQSAIGGLELADPVRLYWAGIGASQLISNVPAVIGLAEYSQDWRVMAYAANVGGFGWMVGSLANLIALRMAQDSRAWISFHLCSVPFLAAAAAVGYGLLFTLNGPGA